MFQASSLMMKKSLIVFQGKLFVLREKSPMHDNLIKNDLFLRVFGIA